MPFPLLAATAGVTAVAAYLDAKYHVSGDVARGAFRDVPAETQSFIAQRMKEDRLMLYHDLQRWAHLNHPNHLFLEYQGRSWTYTQFFADLQRVGNWLMNDLGIQRHEIVAINGPNSAEYMMLWLALDGIGACQSFINHNLTEKALSHSVKLCKPRYLLVERELHDQVERTRDEMAASGVQIVYYDAQLFATFQDSTPIPASRTAGFRPTDLRSLIYTSGTTGLPKGVFLSTGRNINSGRNMTRYLGLKPGVKMFTCLPLYHGSAQALCAGPVIYSGASLRLGRKFSHKTFWNEVSESGAHILQYVGELCRYLVNAPPHPLERKHSVTMAWGNGMRPDVWEAFRQRFNIPIINELYAATDGLGASFNWNLGDFGRNAIAIRGPLWNATRGKTEVRVKIDPDTEDLMRSPKGWAIKCGANEPGEVLHWVEPTMAAASFRGYYDNSTATQKRWIRNVFVEGDLYFRSGDMMRQDADGRVFFVDRLGDTFRWKSENVSTNEVADVLGLFHQIAEANVYGVAIPHADGRCGCAMVVLKDGVTAESLDRVALSRHVRTRLPRYAVPLFLRIVPGLSYTGTFKIQKGQAKREGADWNVITSSSPQDRLLWLRPNAAVYEPYSQSDWEALVAGSISM